MTTRHTDHADPHGRRARRDQGDGAMSKKITACRACGARDQLYRYTPGFMRRHLNSAGLQPDGDPEWHPSVSRAIFACEACDTQVFSAESLVEVVEP
jgi:hypothetical protein